MGVAVSHGDRGGKNLYMFLFVSSLYMRVETLPAGKYDQSLGINEVN